MNGSSLDLIHSQKQNKVKISPMIQCAKCRKDSGWTNDDVKKIRQQVDLKCENCNEVTILVNPVTEMQVLISQHITPKQYKGTNISA